MQARRSRFGANKSQPAVNAARFTCPPISEEFPCDLVQCYIDLLGSEFRGRPVNAGLVGVNAAGRLHSFHSHVELRHLRYFMAAAEEEHFGRAAERLHVTRPAVSQIIADLEDEVGTPLFERLAHRVTLTAAGRAFLPKVQSVMIELNDSLAMARRVGQGVTGRLSLGYGSLTLLHSLFRAAIKEFRDTYPDVTLSLVEIPTADQYKALAEGRIQAGFMHLSPDSALIHKKKGDALRGQEAIVLDWFRIQNGVLGVVVPSDHRLARRKSVSLKELAAESFVVVPRASTSPGYGLIHWLCQKAGFEPHIVQEVSTTVSQLNLISVGMGIGLVASGKHFAYPPGVIVLPLHDVDYVTNFVFGWIKGQRDPVLDHMIDIVKALAKQQ